MSEAESETPESAGASSVGSGSKSNDPAWVQALLTVDRYIGLGEQALLVVFLVSLIAVGSYQAIGRNFLNLSPAWSFDALRYLVFFIAIFGAALSAHTKQVIRMDVLTRVLSPRGRAYARLTTGVFTIAVSLFLAYAFWHFRSTALASETKYEFIPISTVALAMPIGMVLISFHILVQMIVMATTLARGEVPVEEEQAVH